MSTPSWVVRIVLPPALGAEARTALETLVPRLAGHFSFQGMEDWSVDVKNSRVLGVESEFHDLRKAGRQSAEMLVYFGDRVGAAGFGKALCSVVADADVRAPRKQPPRDWMKLWRKHYKTQTLREGSLALHIVPAWKKRPKGGLSVRITPGQAFGTGTHATTRLCLRLFLRHAGKANGSLLDFGAGTGVLALAAARRGFRGVAVESDPVALEQCRKNVRLNRVTRLRCTRTAPRGRHELVFANVLAPVLLAHRGILLESVKKGGLLILSGLLAAEARGFLKNFHRGDFHLVEILEEGDWAAIALRQGRA